MLAHYKSELICDLAEYYNILDYRRVPGRLLGTLAVGLRADSRIGMVREGIKVDPATIMLVKLYDVLLQVFGDKKNKPDPLIKNFIIEHKTDEDTPTKFNTVDDFHKAWEQINKGE